MRFTNCIELSKSIMVCHMKKGLLTLEPFYENRKNEYRMDILKCPYCRVFTELGAPELAKYSCESDDIVYGNLPGIDFIRTQTLATGGTRCDFYLRLSDK